jgi:pimeloyl-ACP methyl ester carboxylesterase
MYCVDSIYREGEYVHFLNIEASKADAPIVVLLHGFPDNAFGWELQVDALKGQFHIIAPFMLGTLNDQLISEERINSNELKQDLKAIITKIRNSKSQKIYFIAHDLGSFLSVSLCSEMENEVHGLIHINGLGLDQFVSRKFDLTQWLKSYYILLAQFSLVRTLVKKIMPKYFLKKIYTLSGISANDSLRTNDARVFNSIVIYKHLFRKAINHLGHKNKKISIPSLFIWGKDDSFLNIPTLNEVEKFYKNGVVRILDGGHWVSRSKAAQVNRLILKTIGTWEKTL